MGSGDVRGTPSSYFRSPLTTPCSITAPKNCQTLICLILRLLHCQCYCLLPLPLAPADDGKSEYMSFWLHLPCYGEQERAAERFIEGAVCNGSGELSLLLCRRCHNGKTVGRREVRRVVSFLSISDGCSGRSRSASNRFFHPDLLWVFYNERVLHVGDFNALNPEMSLPASLTGKCCSQKFTLIITILIPCTTHRFSRSQSISTRILAVVTIIW